MNYPANLQLIFFTFEKAYPRIPNAKENCHHGWTGFREISRYK